MMMAVMLISLTPQSVFAAAKQMEAEDVIWFQTVLQKTDYVGVIFDMGSGVMRSFQMLQAFDVIFVPYLEEETARIKKGNFKELFALQGMEDCEERVHFLNMDNSPEVKKRLYQILGGEP